MPFGEGKYDGALTLALDDTEANEGVLIILSGVKGSGFSVQASKEMMERLPEVLEYMAKGIRKDLPIIK